MIKWPNNKKFAFTIFDDTDGSNVSNVNAVYDLLSDLGLKTTKSVWTEPSRDQFTGECLKDNDYKNFVLSLQKKGFEIAYHGAGSGQFTRNEINSSLDYFKKEIGSYPKLHANHSQNIDNLYWGYKRFSAPLSWLYKFKHRRIYEGEDENSPHYWGDLASKHIKYIRNHTFNNINTLKVDPFMPYVESKKTQAPKYWFSSSDGHTVREFNQLLSAKNIDQLEQEGGLCIIYTHFASGFYNEETKELDPTFVKSIKAVAARQGWFAPTGEILDFLITQKGKGKSLSNLKALKLDFNWFYDRLKKRFRSGI